MVTKKGAGKSKASGAGSSADKAGSKADKAGSKADKAGSKADKGSSKADKAGSKAGVGDVVTGVQKPTVFPKVALTAPPRTGRSLRKVDDAVEEVEFRLRVAEKYEATLRPALGLGEKFLPTGWTAVGILKVPVASAGDGAAARSARATMVEKASTIRTIVVRLTRPEDPARDAVLVGKVVDPNLFASVEQCEAILEGAKSLQGRFAALTDELLKRVAVEVDKAKGASKERKGERTSTKVEALMESDERQLAIDVVHECVDQLAAAALATMSESHPNVVARLARALEPDNEESKAPPPTPPA